MDLSEFVPVKNFEDRYLISRKGEVWSLRTNKFICTTIDKDGYLKKHLFNGTKLTNIRLHRLLAIQFIINDNSLKNQINHKDGNKQNNSLDNLEWCTSQENHKHAQMTGLLKGRKGIAHHNVKLTEKDVIDIKVHLKNKTLECRHLAKIYNVNPGTIQKINRGVRWSHIKV